MNLVQAKRTVAQAGALPAALLAFTPSWSLAADSPSVMAAPSKSEVKVGEVFAVQVKASGPEGTVWTFPEQAGNDSVDIRRASPAAGPASAPREAPEPASAAPPPNLGHYDVAVFAVGEVELPAIPVKYRLPDGSEGEVSTAAVPLRIVSVLPKEPGEQKLADIHGPLALSIGAAFWLGVSVLALLLVALAVWWRLRRRRVQPLGQPVASERAPDAEARESLDRLAASGLLARGECRAFYIALTEIAKRYLERRLEAPILEMTSSEMVVFLRDHHAHGRGFTPAMRDLAAAADQVKFAAGSGRAEEAERHLAAVKQMVDALEARLRPRPGEAPAEKVA